MPPPGTPTVQQVVAAPSWNARVTLIRQMRDHYGVASWKDLYARLAKELYVPQLTPDFAHVHWRPEYEYDRTATSYELAYVGTDGFTKVSTEDIYQCIIAYPSSLLTFRLLLAYTRAEMAGAAAAIIAQEELDLKPFTASRIDSIESKAVKFREGDRYYSLSVAQVLAETITRGIERCLFPSPSEGQRSKQDRIDLVDGWDTVRQYANNGVPFDVFLHQRHYGGFFSVLLNATSKNRGDALEDEVEALFQNAGIQFIRTGSSNQSEIEQRFNITVKPAPDFVIYDHSGMPRALLECKATNDGGTARDKAARFNTLRSEGMRLGGIPVFAVISGLGWNRTSDALGPVIQHCDGRVFTQATLEDMLAIDPFPALANTV